MDLASLLIQPVQRLPRYQVQISWLIYVHLKLITMRCTQLLLKELLKFTPSTHVDYDNLVEALERIKVERFFASSRAILLKMISLLGTQ